MDSEITEPRSAKAKKLAVSYQITERVSSQLKEEPHSRPKKTKRAPNPFGLSLSLFVYLFQHKLNRRL